MQSVYKLLGSLGLFLSASIFSFADPPELSSDRPIEYDENTQDITAQGNARLLSDKALVKADEIRFNRENFNAAAVCNVSINTSGTRLLTDSVNYNINDQTLNMGRFRTGLPPMFISGASASGIMDHLCFETPVVFFGEPDAISPNFIALNAELKHAQDDCAPTEVIAHHILLRIGKIPFFYLPYFSHTAREIPFSINNENGTDKKLGHYTRNTILFQANPYIKFGALIDYYTKEGSSPDLQQSIEKLMHATMLMASSNPASFTIQVANQN